MSNLRAYTIAVVIVAIWSCPTRAQQSDAQFPAPVAIVKGKMPGHTHPSLCRTRGGELLVSYQSEGRLVLSLARSRDGGVTWDKPAAIAVTAKRPDFIPAVPEVQVYPGTLDTLRDGRILLTWQYLASDRAKEFRLEPLLYSLSADDGKTWTEARPFGSNGNYLGAMRNSVLEWSADQWLLPLRKGAPALYDSTGGTITPYRFAIASGRQPSCLQMVRTSKGTLLAMGQNLLRSADAGKNWAVIANFPGPTSGDSSNGRFLTPLADASIVLTWGEGRDNVGFRLSLSSDDGLTWRQPSHRLPKTDVHARFGSPRTLPLDEANLGTVYFNEAGLFFVRTPIIALK